MKYQLCSGLLMLGLSASALASDETPCHACVAQTECPKDTAFSVLVDSDRMYELQNYFTHLINSSPDAFEDYFKQGLQVAAAAGSTLTSDISIYRNPDLRLPTVRISFKTSEQPAQDGTADRLIFEMDAAAQTAKGERYISYILSDESQIAGHARSRWKGQGGDALKITNSCVLKQLAKLKNTGGDFRKPDGTPSAFGGPDWVEPGVDDAAVQRCIVHFFQAGSLLYAFQVPARQC